MTTALIVIAAWFAVSIPFGLAVGRILRGCGEGEPKL